MLARDGKSSTIKMVVKAFDRLSEAYAIQIDIMLANLEELLFIS